MNKFTEKYSVNGDRAQTCVHTRPGTCTVLVQ